METPIPLFLSGPGFDAAAAAPLPCRMHGRTATARCLVALLPFTPTLQAKSVHLLLLHCANPTTVSARERCPVCTLLYMASKAARFSSEAPLGPRKNPSTESAVPKQKQIGMGCQCTATPQPMVPMSPSPRPSNMMPAVKMSLCGERPCRRCPCPFRCRGQSEATPASPPPRVGSPRERCHPPDAVLLARNWHTLGAQSLLLQSVRLLQLQIQPLQVRMEIGVVRLSDSNHSTTVDAMHNAVHHSTTVDAMQQSLHHVIHPDAMHNAGPPLGSSNPDRG